MRRWMTIGELAEAAGVGVETVRYYQRKGLIATPPAPAGRQRRYAHSVLEEIAFIKRAQGYGFTLDEIGAIRRSAGRCGDARVFAQGKLDELSRQVEEIMGVARRLEDVLKKCEANSPSSPCPFIEALRGRAG
jgi:MerR family mercuric resistance operon transcriptional regulator